MVLAMGGSMIGSLSRSGGQRKRKLRGERRDYLRYLGQMRRNARRSARQQAEAMIWNHPEPAALWTIAASRRMWERRPTHGDYGEVRLGTGTQQLAVNLSPPASKPVEDLEPMCLAALRGFLEAHRSVPDLPIAIQALDFARILIRPKTVPVEVNSLIDWYGDKDAYPVEDALFDDAVAGSVRALLAQLVTFHSPDELRVVVCSSRERQIAWDWVKWLPHSLHPTDTDGVGNRRMVAENLTDLERLLGTTFMDRPRFDDRAPVSKDEPWTVIILDDVPVPPTARIASAGIRNCTVIDVSETFSWAPDNLTLRLRADAQEIQLISADQTGKETAARLCTPDLLSFVAMQALTRRLSPYRIGTSVETANPLVKNFDLTTLMGIGDPYTFEVEPLRSKKSRWDHLRIPIGITDTGSPVELDLKEAAQGGMGPHGLLIGATGSGKSELLRTLILGLAVRHSSDVLNFVLVDFKGGATFLGCERLPHTSAMITNLSDELPLVDRMQEALQGELIRRQELLRSSGFASARDYMKAHSEGAEIPPLPTLLIIVDEFSELLSSKREFIDLFVMIGRLGRSLGVHLLLASQRIDEGRMHALESHLSYRIGLRTFSAIESRSVIGVPNAYELPSAPGNGYFRPDTTSLVRFKAAYVSAPYRVETSQRRQREVRRRLMPYIVGYVQPTEPDPAAEEEIEVDEEASSSVATLMEIILDRLAGVGPEAHRVWLPPLHDPPSLDGLLPPLVADDARGFSTEQSSNSFPYLCVPVGIIDRPLEQRRDPLLAELTGAGGHVGIAGGPQSGKSTLLRSLMLSLALRHTPREVQIFALDFGGGALSGLTQLPHVGSIAGRLDPERVGRTIAETKTLLAERERRFAEFGVDSMTAFRQQLRAGTLPPGLADGFGDLFLVVDGWGTLRQDFEQLESGFSELATNGLNYGIHLVVTATRWSEIRPWLRDLLGTRFELRLGDAVESEIGMRVAANVPAIPGRGLTREAKHFLAAVPRIDGVNNAEDLSEAVRAAADAVAQAWSGPPTPTVRLLPTSLDFELLPEPADEWAIALGLDEDRLAPVWHDFDHAPHLMLFGDSECGKTNALRLIAKSIISRHTPDEARIIVADSRRDLYDAVPPEYQLGYAVTAASLEELLVPAIEVLTQRLPGADISPDQIRRQDWWDGPRLFILVDDYDLLTTGSTGPLAKLGQLLSHAAAIGLHVVLARSSAGVGRTVVTDATIRQLWDIGSPSLVFSCGREEGSFLGNVRPIRLPAGRAQLLTRRRAPLLVQTAYRPVDSTVGR